MENRRCLLSSAKQEFSGYQMISALLQTISSICLLFSFFSAAQARAVQQLPKIPSPFFNPFSTEQPKWSFKIVNQILTPFSLKILQWFISHLKSQSQAMTLHVLTSADLSNFIHRVSFFHDIFISWASFCFWNIQGNCTCLRKLH